MKRFWYKCLCVFVSFIIAIFILLFAFPKDKNHRVYEYNHKITLLENVDTPRIVIIGGSSVAFSVDSKRIKDSLNRNVVNFGLHAGIGIRYVMEDYLNYVKKNDLAVIQIEYAHFYTGGNGNNRTLTQLMVATNWRHIEQMNMQQYANIIDGIPPAAIENLNRLVKYPLRRSWDTPYGEKSFRYTKKGFNEYGDEVSHWNYKSRGIVPKGIKETRKVDKAFLTWLADILLKYERKGAKVVMVPPVNVVTNFMETYNENVGEALKSINRDYVVPYNFMVLDDSCSFDGGYHVNKAGVDQNTTHLIEIFRKQL